MQHLTPTHPVVILPFILVISLLFAFYFIDFPDVSTWSLPEPYWSLVLVLLFYGCTLSLSLFLLAQSKTPLAPHERKTSRLYVAGAETVLATLWSSIVLTFTPATDEGPYSTFWTDGLSFAAVMVFILGALTTAVVGVTREHVILSLRTGGLRNAPWLTPIVVITVYGHYLTRNTSEESTKP
jgi:hypothetical protein